MPILEEAKQEIADVLTRHASHIKELIRSWDTDCNGLISRTEFRSAVRELLPLCPFELCDSVFDSWDADGAIVTYKQHLAARFRPLVTVPQWMRILHLTLAGSGQLDYIELMLKARRAAFERGFVPKHTVSTKTSMHKLNAYWARKNRTAVDSYLRVVENTREVSMSPAYLALASRDVVLLLTREQENRMAKEAMFQTEREARREQLRRRQADACSS